MPAPKGNKNAKGNKGGGRPDTYKPAFAKQAFKLCLLGAIDTDLADFFEVSEVTINNWKKWHVEFNLALKRGKMESDANVADRLYQRAMGFEHDSEEIKVIDNMVERVPVRKIYPPDTTAAIFWLKNRQSKNWRDKVETELSGEVKGQVAIFQLPENGR